MTLPSAAVPPSAAPTAATLPGRRGRWLVLAVCAVSVLLVGIDQSIVAIALPAIGADLAAGTVSLEWVVDAYVTAASALLISAGVLADRFGRRRVFTVGLGVFALGSVLCAAAPTVELLVAARALQGVGAAALVPVGLAVVATVAQDARERAHMIGTWGAVFGVSLALGPVIGGLLLEAFDWRALFWVNVPVAAAALLLCPFVVPENRAASPRRLDPVGQALLAVLLGSLVVIAIDAPGGRGGPVVVAVAAGAAVLSAVGLFLASRRRRQPLLPPALFARPPFIAAIVGAAAVFAVLSLTLVSGSLALQQEDGLSALDAALRLTPLALAAAVLAPVSGALVARAGPRLPLLLAAGCTLVGGALVAVGGVAGSALDDGPGIGGAWAGAVIVTGYLVVGAGFGLANAPITTTALAGLPSSQTGVAASITATARQFGAALGAAAGGFAASTTPSLAVAGLGVAVLAVPLVVAGVARRSRGGGLSGRTRRGRLEGRQQHDH